MKKIIFSDIDGTYYSHKQELHKDTNNDITNFQKNGGIFVPTTGNGYFTNVKKVAEWTNADYVITSNGGLVFNNKTKEVLFEKRLPVAEADMIFQFCIQNQIASNYWDEDKISSNVFTAKEIIEEDLIPAMLSLGNDKVDITTKVEEPVFKIESTDTVENIKKVYDFAIKNGFEVALMNQGKHVEITPKGVSKGKAVLLLCKKLGIDPKDAMAIGDSGNDIPMFKVVGHAYAMGNASDEARKHSNKLTDHVLDNGLGKAIVEYQK